MVPWNNFKRYSLVKIDTKREKQFSERDTGINITYDEDVSSLIEIADNILDFDLAVHFLH